MNFLIVVIVSVVLATGVFNTETKDSEENKKTEIIVKETIEKKPTKEKINLEELDNLIYYLNLALIAQLVEQLICNQ